MTQQSSFYHFRPLVILVTEEHDIYQEKQITLFTIAAGSLMMVSCGAGKKLEAANPKKWQRHVRSSTNRRG